MLSRLALPPSFPYLRFFWHRDLFLPILFLLGSAPIILGQQPDGARQLLKELDAVSLDPSQIYVLRNAQITRDRAKIYFSQGFVVFSSKVEDHVTGAVFSGQGEVLMIPPNQVEKQNLAQFIGATILEEQFVSAYFRFTDQTAQELQAVARRPDPDDPEQPTGLIEQWAPIVREMNRAFSTRIFQDLSGDPQFPYFHARFQKPDGEAFDLNVDERSPEAVSVGSTPQKDGRIFEDIWCSFPSRVSETRPATLMTGPAKVQSYRIDTRIDADNSLQGRTEVELESRSGKDRMLVFELSRWLKLLEVKDDRGQNLEFFQNPSLEQSEVAARGNDWVVVVLASPPKPEERYRLTFSYEGNVITDVGNNVLYVGARGSWYPNRGVTTRATYDLTFHYPERLTLVATGKRVSETSSDGVKHSRWISDGLFSVAGFNLGVYRSSVRKAGGVTIEVYANPEAEALLAKQYAATQTPRTMITGPQGFGRTPSVTILPGPVGALAPAALLDHVARDAQVALERFETMFGPFPYPRLAVSQIPGNFGQGWPELVYIPTLTFLSEPQLADLGGGKYDALQNEVLVAHEIAHQWWGNQVGWRTYHDQWLSEGLATFAAALCLKYEKGGEGKFRNALHSYKRDLLSKTSDGKTVESGGPIWLGERLSNSLNPGGYANIVYKKACWVIQMLRMMMTEATTGSDDRFFKMLRDFIIAYRGKDPSTQDFIRHAEKYISRANDLDHNGKLDWFFNEWVFGTGIPTYTIHPTTRQAAKGDFLIQGSIEQSGVSQDFEMLVPVVATYGKDKKVLLGQVPVGETGGKFRFTSRVKPSRVTIDEDNILAIIH